MFSKPFRRALPVFIIAGISLLLTAAPLSHPAAHAAPPGQAVLPEQAALLEQAAPVGIPVKGYLEPARWVSLAFPAAGLITGLEAGEGDVVAEAAVLARHGDARKDQNRLAQAELELLLAQQAYTDLQKHARIELAQAEQRLAEARKIEERAAWKAWSVQQPASPLTIAQARANLLLAGKSLQAAKKDVQDAERQWADRKDILWRFVPRRLFRLNLTLLHQKAALAEDRYRDAADKLDKLLEPPDEIDVQVAQGALAVARAEVEQAQRQRAAWENGPDPDLAAQAQARIQAAERALQAARASLRDLQITAPFSGVVASVPAKSGEWVQAGQPVLVLADFSAWQVQVDEVKEEDLPAWRVGQNLAVTLDALPGVQMRAVVNSIDLIYQEKDGDPVYSVSLALLGASPGLRWGMTARVAP